MKQITKVSMSTIKPGYIYVLTHPSDPNLYKIGVTILEPSKRLAQHNSDLSKAAGRISEETGQKWELKEYHAVPDPYHAESAFWSTTPYQLIPYYDGVEVERMSWEEVQRGLEAAKKAGHRPPPKPFEDWVYAYTASMRKRLEGRGIVLLGYVRSKSGKSDFLCICGHKWKTTPDYVAEGEGCPKCDNGKRSEEEIRKMINAGVIHLLTHPDKPGLIKIGMEYARSEEDLLERPRGGWERVRFQNVEDMDLAEILMCKLFGSPYPYDYKPIEKDLSIAGKYFSNLHYAIRAEIALQERRRDF
jgi:hypothetical protein